MGTPNSLDMGNGQDRQMVQSACKRRYTSMEDKQHRLDAGQPTDIVLEFTFDSPGEVDITDALPEAEGGRL